MLIAVCHFQRPVTQRLHTATTNNDRLRQAPDFSDNKTRTCSVYWSHSRGILGISSQRQQQKKTKVIWQQAESLSAQLLVFIRSIGQSL